MASKFTTLMTSGALAASLAFGGVIVSTQVASAATCINPQTGKPFKCTSKGGAGGAGGAGVFGGKGGGGGAGGTGIAGGSDRKSTRLNSSHS